MQTSEPTAAAGQPATDPSRSAPKCQSCRHFCEDDHAWCNHPAAGVSLITGEPAVSCTTMRGAFHPQAPKCGPSGQWFEPGVPRCSTCDGKGRVRLPYALNVSDCPDCAVSRNSTGAPISTLPVDPRCLAPGMAADYIFIRTYTVYPDGTSHEHHVELIDALRPEIAQRIDGGGAFQLVVWGQGGRPKLVPQPPEPVQDLGTSATAAGSPPAPNNLTTNTLSDTCLPATEQA